MLVFADKSLEFLDKSKKSYKESIRAYECLDFGAFTNKMYDTCFTACQALYCLLKQNTSVDHHEVCLFVKKELVARKYIGQFLYELYVLMGVNSNNLQADTGNKMSRLGNVDLVKSESELFLEVVYKLIISLSGERVSI